MAKSKDNLKDGYHGALRDSGDAASAGDTFVAVDLVNPVSVDLGGMLAGVTYDYVGIVNSGGGTVDTYTFRTSGS